MAAAQLLPQLVRSGVVVVRNQLDGLLVRFQESNSNFHEEYSVIRHIVDTRGGRANGGAQVNTTALPGAGTAAVNKAARPQVFSPNSRVATALPKVGTARCPCQLRNSSSVELQAG